MTGQQVFQYAQQAINALQQIAPVYIPTSDPTLASQIAAIDSAMRLVASTSIGGAQAASGNANDITEANQQLAEGDSQITSGNPAGAVGQFQQAWQLAQAAMGYPTAAPQNCNISDSEAGQPIITGSINPGDTISNQTVTISNSGDESVITLSEANLSHSTSACPTGVNCPAGFSTGNLAHQLELTIVDTTNSNKLIYQGPLGALTPTIVCGTSAGTCSTWINNESHVFSFTVSMPNQPCTGTTTLAACPDNAFQGTGASVDFDWARSADGPSTESEGGIVGESRAIHDMTVQHGSPKRRPGIARRRPTGHDKRRQTT